MMPNKQQFLGHFYSLLHESVQHLGYPTYFPYTPKSLVVKENQSDNITTCLYVVSKYIQN